LAYFLLSPLLFNRLRRLYDLALFELFGAADRVSDVRLLSTLGAASQEQNDLLAYLTVPLWSTPTVHTL
jgi:hypothetical protein